MNASGRRITREHGELEGYFDFIVNCTTADALFA